MLVGHLPRAGSPNRPLAAVEGFATQDLRGEEMTRGRQIQHPDLGLEELSRRHLKRLSEVVKAFKEQSPSAMFQVDEDVSRHA